MHPTIDQIIKLLANEALLRKRLLAGLFALISLGLVTVGAFWPKTYTSSTSVLIEKQQVIGPLIEGTGVSKSSEDQTKIARDIVFSRRNMEPILKAGGWQPASMSPVERERLFEDIQRNTLFTMEADNLLRIAYRDSQPERAHGLASQFGELFIDQSHENRKTESRKAYEFISGQVAEYKAKLEAAEQELEDFREAHMDTRPEDREEVNDRISELRLRLERTRLDLDEERTRKQSLQEQLSGEAKSANVDARENEIRDRIAELQNERENLLLNYTESHPDVVRLQHQVEDLMALLKRERKTGPADKQANASTSPLYQQLRSDLSRSKTNINTLQARIGKIEQQLKKQLHRANRIHQTEAKLDELNRNHEVIHDVYRDLLRKRENARVTMNLDQEKNGTNLKIHEPAALPLTASGLRFLHFLIGGLGLGTVGPTLLLYGMVNFDTRVRDRQALEKLYGRPVLAQIAHLGNAESGMLRDRDMRVVLACVAAVVIGYLVAIGLKLTAVI